MFLFDFFRSFLPLHNPLGFGAFDFLLLLLALMLVLMALVWRPWLDPYARRLAAKPLWSMLLLALLPLVLRLLLLPNHPVPEPDVGDEFGHLLVADTLLHFRLANPPHPLPQFFETYFTLQEPTYSSIYPIGQGLILALGRLLGHPWLGVLLTTSALCALAYWMLLGWTTPGWALLGGLLAVCEFGPLGQWTNSYWGGGLSAIAGCLVFGALPRLRNAWRTRDAVLLGLGIAIQLLTRPYEALFLGAGVLLFFLPAWRRLARAIPVAAIVVLPAFTLILLQNHQITGSWATLPYVLSRYQYGVPTTFTVQANPLPHRQLTQEQQNDYDVQVSIHGREPESLPRFLDRLRFRVRVYRFFFLAPLYVALPVFLVALPEFRFVWIFLCLAIFSLGANFYPYFFPHYIAVLTSLFLLVSVTALERLSRWNFRGLPSGLQAVRLVVFLCILHFVFWYGLHVVDNRELSVALRQYETWYSINHGDPEGRAALNASLAQAPGKHLVFVHYWPKHTFHEWVHNAADIDGARIVWARDLGSVQNQQLTRYYPDRTVWLLEPDFRPPRITRYQSSVDVPFTGMLTVVKH